MKKLLILFAAVLLLVAYSNKIVNDNGVFIGASQKMAVMGDTVYFLDGNNGICSFQDGKVTTLFSEERLFLSRLFVYNDVLYATGMDLRASPCFALLRKEEENFKLLFGADYFWDANVSVSGIYNDVFMCIAILII